MKKQVKMKMGWVIGQRAWFFGVRLWVLLQISDQLFHLVQNTSFVQSKEKWPVILSQESMLFSMLTALLNDK